jgi:hypothetical protein
MAGVKYSMSFPLMMFLSSFLDIAVPANSVVRRDGASVVMRRTNSSGRHTFVPVANLRFYEPPAHQHAIAFGRLFPHQPNLPISPSKVT